MSEPTPETGTPPETGEPQPDEGADGDEEEGSEEAQPPAPEAAPPVDMEKALKALSRENDRHGKRVADIMGADFALFRPCPLDDGMGFIGPDVSIVQAYRYDPDTNALALVSTSATPIDLYRDDAEKEPCGRCDALGMLRTGSKVPNNETVPCGDCGGAGYKSKIAAITTLPAPTQVADDPEVAALKARGFTVLPPFEPSQASG